VDAAGCTVDRACSATLSVTTYRFAPLIRCSTTAVLRRDAPRTDAVTILLRIFAILFWRWLLRALHCRALHGNNTRTTQQTPPRLYNASRCAHSDNSFAWPWRGVTHGPHISTNRLSAAPFNAGLQLAHPTFHIRHYLVHGHPSPPGLTPPRHLHTFSATLVYCNMLPAYSAAHSSNAYLPRPLPAFF